MIRAHVLIVGGVPHLHITRPGAPAETRPMDQREVVRLMEEVARAVLATVDGSLTVEARSLQKMQRSAEDRTCKDCLQVGDRFAGVGNVIEDDVPPSYVGALGE